MSVSSETPSSLVTPAPAPLHLDARDAAARLAFAYLSETDALPAGPADAVIGFGVFDVRLAVFCGELFARGHARHVIFTGGIGAGTGHLAQAEADAWAAELLRAYPDFPRTRLILENRSTNTTENIAFTAALLASTRPELAFDSGLRSALIVASPSRLRRARLTLLRHFPGLHITRCLPPNSFENEQALNAAHGFDYVEHLTGELNRIVDYPARGWIAAEPLPPAIVTAHVALR